MERLARALRRCRRGGPAAARRPTRRCRRCGCRRRRAAACCSGCTAAPICLGSPRTHAAMVGGAGAAGPGSGRCCRTTGWRRSTRSRRRSRTPAPPGTRWSPRASPPARIALGGDSAGGGLAFALLHLLLADGRAAAGLRRRLQPVGRPDAGRRKPRRGSRGAMRLLPAGRLAEIRDLYLAGADPRDPRASPCLGALRGRAAGADPGEPRRDPARRRPHAWRRGSPRTASR